MKPTTTAVLLYLCNTSAITTTTTACKLPCVPTAGVTLLVWDCTHLCCGDKALIDRGRYNFLLSSALPKGLTHHHQSSIIADVATNLTTQAHNIGNQWCLLRKKPAAHCLTTTGGRAYAQREEGRGRGEAASRSRGRNYDNHKHSYVFVRTNMIYLREYVPGKLLPIPFLMYLVIRLVDTSLSCLIPCRGRSSVSEPI